MINKDNQVGAKETPSNAKETPLRDTPMNISTKSIKPLCTTNR